MSNPPDAISTVAIPAESELIRQYKSTNFSDAYAVELPPGSTTDPEQLASFIFSHQAPWVERLMKLRDLLVARLGIKTSAELARVDPTGKVRRIGIFRIYNTSRHEIVLGEDDSHLNFRLSVLCAPSATPAGPHRLTLSTVVHCHNELGRLYIFLIAPFHRAVVRSSLRRAAQTGWPKV